MSLDKRASGTTVQYPVQLGLLAVLSSYGIELQVEILEPYNPSTSSIVQTRIRVFEQDKLDLVVVAATTRGGTSGDSWAYVAMASPCCGEIEGELHTQDDIMPFCSECDEAYPRLAGLPVAEQLHENFAGELPGEKDLLGVVEAWLAHSYSYLDPLSLCLAASDFAIWLDERGRADLAALKTQIALPVAD